MLLLGTLICVEFASAYGKSLSTGCFEDAALLGGNISKVISCNIRLLPTVKNGLR
jgi:hypothetical protein